MYKCKAFVLYWQTSDATHPNSGKVVLSLFDYTGNWSRPWTEADSGIRAEDIGNGINDAYYDNDDESAEQALRNLVGSRP